MKIFLKILFFIFTMIITVGEVQSSTVINLSQEATAYLFQQTESNIVSFVFENHSEKYCLKEEKAVSYREQGVSTNTVAAKTGGRVATNSLNPTHHITKSKTQMQALMNDIRVNGIQEPIKYVENNGAKYIVDGHHRFYSAQKLGIQNVPVQQVQLPYGGYKSAFDLMLDPGKHPGFWFYMK